MTSVAKAMRLRAETLRGRADELQAEALRLERVQARATQVTLGIKLIRDCPNGCGLMVDCGPHHRCPSCGRIRFS